MQLEPDKILRGTKGTIAERPLPLLFQAIWATRRTCGLELKRQAFEKVLVFESGVPVGCSSNLVHETLGRHLVEKKVIDEQQHMKLLAEAASREVKLEQVLLDHKVLEPAALSRHVNANLVQKILDAFLWTEARYRILGDVEIASDAPRMNAPQLLLTALGTALPWEQVKAQFPIQGSQRFARVHAPAIKLDELKLNVREQRLLEAIAHRPTVAELVSFADLEEEAIARRLYAFSLLGLIDLAERVPKAAPQREKPVPPAAVQASVPPERPRRRTVAISLAIVGAAAAGAVATLALHREPPAPVPAAAPAPVVSSRIKPRGARPAELPSLVAAPEGAVPQPGRGAGLELSASGILLEPPQAPSRKLAPFFGFAASHLRSGRPEAALAIYEAAVRNAPDRPEPLLGAAISLHALGRDAEALGRVGEALAKAPADSESLLLAGGLELAGAHAEKARQKLEAFLKMAPADRRAADVRLLLAQLPAEGADPFAP